MEADRIRNEFIMYLEDINCYDECKAVNAFDKILRKYDINAKETSLSTKFENDPMILVQIYEKIQRMKGRSKASIENYMYTLRLFFTWTSKMPNEINSIDIISFLSDYKESRNVNHKTLNCIRVHLSSFFTWAKKVGYINNDPMALIDKFEVQKTQRDYLTSGELEELRFCANTLKEKALIEFMASSACRITEISNISLRDINWDNATCKVIGKGNKERSVSITPKAMIAINEYLASRGYGILRKNEGLSRREKAIQRDIIKNKIIPLDKKNSDEYLFMCKKTKTNPDGHPSSHNLRNTFESIVSRTSFSSSKWCTPHTIRHTWATLARSRGMSIEDISTYLGHENISTTMIYVSLDKDKIHNDVIRFAV